MAKTGGQVSVNIEYTRSGQLEKRTYYRVISNSDLNEGRGVHITVGIYTTHNEAYKAAKGAGVMGSNAEVSSETSLVFRDDLTGELFLLGDQILTEHVDINKIRERALAKLTAEEKEALGL